MLSRFERLLIALMFALLAAGITLVLAQAQTGTPPPPAETPGCATCHPQFETTWEAGPHGQAGTDPVFVEDWSKQGKPGACLVCHVTGYDPATATWKQDGVACEACHGPANPDHPNQPMPIDRSTDLCGRCHSDTRFGWQEWQGSTHYQRGMSCATCHDPHSASLKITEPITVGGATFKDASQLCITCHTEYSMDFSYSIHNQEGITCVECHVTHTEASGGRPAHTVPDHSFNASLASCNTCHREQMHDPAAGNPDEEAAVAGTSSAPPELQQASVTPEPGAVSPVGYAGLAGLIGLAAGMVAAPWLERWYRRMVKHDGEAGDD